MWADRSVVYYKPHNARCFGIYYTFGKSRGISPGSTEIEDTMCEIEPPAESKWIPLRNFLADLKETLPISAVNSSQSFIECPQGHMTYSFLACNDMNECWAQGNSPGSYSLDFTGVPSFDNCPAPMLFLPPSMTCDGGIQTVVYSFVCDGHNDCIDSSDEIFCVWPACGSEKPLRCSQSQQVMTELDI